jgi:hypothetical protein
MIFQPLKQGISKQKSFLSLVVVFDVVLFEIQTPFLKLHKNDVIYLESNLLQHK